MPVNVEFVSVPVLMLASVVSSMVTMSVPSPPFTVSEAAMLFALPAVLVKA